jgi:hypothetical protein
MIPGGRTPGVGKAKEGKTPPVGTPGVGKEKAGGTPPVGTPGGKGKGKV